jgi:hypothetical protein
VVWFTPFVLVALLAGERRLERAEPAPAAREPERRTVPAPA